MVAPTTTATASPSRKMNGSTTTVKKAPATEDNDRALHYKEEGNRFYASKEYSKAATAYKLGLALLNNKSGDSTDLEVALRSNLAIVLLKLEQYEEGRKECQAAIALDPNQTKLWYRRALAHEGLHDWSSAISDLKECLDLFGVEAGDNSSMKKAAQDALQRISQKEQVSYETNHDYAHQRQSVLTLLEARQVSLQPELTKEGEAFFLVDYKWWQQWCSRAKLFPKANGNKDALRQILALLPPGAVCPTTTEDSKDDLGPIDNSNIILEHSDPFVQQWFKGEQIKPNLVRGHHYEVIPREVYQALVAWYGESTNPICRRTDPKGIVKLYGSSSHHNDDNEPAVVLQTCGACRAPHAKARCKQCLQVYYCGRLCQESHWPHHKTQCGSPRLDRNGKVGFHNLGNTCFMNSALQCLSHATPLTRHFLSNTFLQDVNNQNPLGTGGKLANAYNQMLREVWMAGPTAMSPTTLKRAIAMFAPRFVGCSQHDAQEFLAYLLDGLHEDLNRIREAPYVELPDVNENSDMAIAGAAAWNAHQRRNDSLVMDTFYGQFKSTCVCPQCQCVSVSFDAFNHVSLEIPQPQSNRFIPILVFSKDGKPPERRMVEIRRGCFVAALRKDLSEQCGIRGERLALCDLYEYTMYEILQDSKNVNAIRTTDVLAAFDVDPYTNTTVHAICTHCTLTKEGKRELFGFPFLTSFPADYTCQQVYQHLWKQIQHVPGVKEEWMQVCITDNNGKARPVFPGDTAIVPREYVDKVIDYLGKDCTERFLFVSLEWIDSADLDKAAFIQLTDHSSYTEGLRKERAMGAARSVTLDQCFQTFTRPERLDDNNKWYCSKCKDHVRAMKTMELWRLPNILVVHLKRFEFKHALRRDKLDTFVDFDMEGLDMSKYISHNNTADFVQDQIPAMYDLFAVTNHFGRLGFGHYTAFARPWDEQQGMSKDWALFDDSSVRGVTPDSVVTPAAYVLFYRRRQFS
jgi:ubiquitin C-terminal hydrolase/tetratricopeptide (TPR) repeat protein